MAGFDDLDDLTGTIEDYLERSDLQGRISTFIRLAEVRLDRRLNLADNETLIRFALVDGVAPLPDDYRAWRSVTAPCGTAYGYASPHAFMQARPAEGRGLFTILGSIPLDDIEGSTEPWQFGLSNAFLRASPAVPTIDLVYRQGIPPLSTARPSNWLLAKHPDLYLYAALLEAHPFLGQDGRIATWRVMLEAAIADLGALDRDARWGRASIRISEPTP